MKVTVADSLGMCFGVRDAIELALESPHRRDLTVLGQLVHNPVVLRELAEAGIRTVGSPEEPVTTRHVMITAHGASERATERVRAQGLEVLEATCPLVRHAHRQLLRLVRAGYFPAVIGRSDHVEVRGLVGDLDEYAIVLHPEDLAQLAGRPRLGIISQTTQPLDEARALVEQIRARFPDAEVKFVDTVCQPTKDRQRAARRLAAAADVMVVIGGRTSNNTHQLARACAAEGAATYQVESAADLRAEWFAGAAEVGVTAGTSTPDATIQEVVTAIRRFSNYHCCAAEREAAVAGSGR
jgi:4-hydroxy-3-methylbut-2-enyl diphosphate reductase